MTVNKRPVLLLVAGPPGVGKTTLAFALGSSLGWTVLDKDTLKSCLLRLEIPEAIAGPASYDLLMDIAADNLANGQSLILDGPAHHRSFLDRCAALAAETNAEFRILLCLLDRDERVRRMATRSVRPSQWTALDLDRETDPEEWIAFFPRHAAPLWMNGPPDALTRRALALLGTEAAGVDG